MDISIIIPAYNESNKIGCDIEGAAAFLKDNRLSGEIIVVDDGSKDDTAKAANNAQISPEVHRKVISYERNRGKGYAIRQGMKVSEGKYVMFADSGTCVPYEEVLRGLELLKNGRCDIAHASRKIRTSHIERSQSWYRKGLSWFFHWFVIIFMRIPTELTDTQCGFKLYRGEIGRELYRQCKTDGFMFDIEIVIRAQKEGYCIKEFPIDWTCDRDSRLSLTRTPLHVLTELISIKRNLSKKGKT